MDQLAKPFARGGLRMFGMEAVPDELRLVLLALGVEPRGSAEEEAA